LKIYNRLFTDAWHSFSLLRFYYEHVTGLLQMSVRDFLEDVDELDEEYKKLKNNFDKQQYLKRFNVYEEIYPGFFNNSFLLSACALFEYHIKKIYLLVKEEHKMPLEWDDIEGNVPVRAKRLLKLAGIELHDYPSDSMSNLIHQNNMNVEDTWREIENYYMIRNCLAHYNGVIQKARNADKIKKYAMKKKVLMERDGRHEVLLSITFNKGVCDTMGSFFMKLTSAYYGARLPE
jgi:hypothetical protein